MTDLLTKLRFYQLEKQDLACKADSENTLALVKEHLALHSTDYLTPYISLWARVSDFSPDILFNSLRDTGETVRLRAFRGTIFVIHRDNLPDIMGALHAFRSQRSGEVERLFNRSGADYNALERAILALLKERDALTAAEIKKSLRLEYRPELFPVMLRLLEFKGVLARSGPRYVADKVIKYIRLEPRVPDKLSGQDSPDAALRSLVQKYIRKFGPISLDDLCWWLPLNRSSGRTVLNELQKELMSFAFREREYFMTAADYAALQDYQVPKNLPPQIHFLPYEDHFPKAYAVRDGFISQSALPLVYQIRRIEKGQLRPTIWLNGSVIGRWEMEWADKTRSRQKVRVIELVKDPGLSAKTTSLIEQQRKELEIFLNERLVPLMRTS